MTDAIREAQAVLQAECDKLSAVLHAKGYHGAHAEIWIGRYGTHALVWVEHDAGTPDPRISYIPTQTDVCAAIDNAREVIAKAPELVDPASFAPYFAWTPAEAAE